MNSRTLEHKLFKGSTVLGVFFLCVLLVHNIFIYQLYFAVILEIIGMIVLVVNYIYLKRQAPSQRQIFIFCITATILVNLGWLTADGINILNASIYFITGSVVILLLDRKYYIWIGVFVIVNLSILYYLESVVNPSILGVTMEIENERLESNYFFTFILFSFGGYLLAYTKINYNRDRDKLTELNLELQNAQQTLHDTVSELEEQKAELAQIRDLLEIKVKERTQDLAQANDRLLNKNQQLEQYSYIISHNLKAPVAQIKGLVHLLPVNDSYDNLTKETIERLQDSAFNLEKVLNDLSAVLRVEKNLQQQWQPIDLQEVLNEVVDSLKNAMQERRVAYIHDATVLPTIMAIRPYVYSVLHNIIENAVKYADPAKKSMHVKVEYSESTKYQQIIISDNGIGIDMEAASGKLFQMYQRFNTTHPGQGFGLYLVKSQMEAINGRVEMESMLGQGTTFRLYFNKKQ